MANNTITTNCPGINQENCLAWAFNLSTNTENQESQTVDSEFVDKFLEIKSITAYLANSSLAMADFKSDGVYDATMQEAWEGLGLILARIHQDLHQMAEKM